MALWRRTRGRVELARMWEVERVSGQKHHAWPLYTRERTEAFLNALLADEGLSLADMSAVWGTPGLPGAQPVTVPAGAEKFPVHSLSHLFSGLLMDTALFKNETIVGLAVDGAPDTVLDNRSPQYWYAGCLSQQGRLSFAPVASPGPLYTAASTKFGLEPGSLMALASATGTAFAFDIAAAVGSLRLRGGRETPWKTAFELVETLLKEAEEQLGSHRMDSAFSREENIRSAVMKHIQRACDLIAVDNVEQLRKLGQVRTEDAYLAMGGGFALNCPTNTLLLDRFKFRGLLTPPCANDSGQALGLGLLGLYGSGAFDGADLRIDSPYQGMPLRDVDAALAEFAPWIADVSDFAADRFVADVTDNVLAWVDGPAEIGPRALGARSLLGDPRTSKVKDLLNHYKQRQWWRPVAPIVLAEHSGDWFAQDRPSPFMLEAVRVRDDAAERVPAIVHLDGTARHQTVTAAANPLLHQAIDAFRERTGVPILCNTSLNDKGEPNVNTAAEALTFCINKGLGLLYLAGRRVELRREPVPATPPPTGPRQRAVGFFAGQEADRDAMWQQWLDQGYTETAIFLLSWSPDIRRSCGTSTPDMVNKLADYYLTSDENFAALAASFRRDGGPGSCFIKAADQLPKPVIVE
ncbi:carbamoyltransferase C-terminal domain-containing protein [Catellatospora sp. KI3]|uniref:carbamoyltransferase C-terminal domain-containing protein n=1 Tax=Catellatospora sp. KI3 TaxID=3041620 RepID=UPI0024823699|nr:carbamoyltransferase C-terminal domain-containing protein [Catellatospora sp. KI3]MDI1460723.1 carbamoyltransferase C-terminal domain-containing protein [Catellatospora sp. KI3]